MNYDLPHLDFSTLVASVKPENYNPDEIVFIKTKSNFNLECLIFIKLINIKDSLFVIVKFMINFLLLY